MRQECFEDFNFFRCNKRYINILEKDHILHHKFKMESVGMEFIKTRSKVPKLTTVATSMFGKYATKNYIELTESESSEYLRRQTWTSPSRPNIESDGYVIARYKGLNLGLVFVRTQNKTHRIESLFPKGRIKAYK